MVTTATPYRKENIKPFFEELLDDDLQQGYLQQASKIDQHLIELETLWMHKTFFFFVINSSVETQKVLNLQQV